MPIALHPIGVVSSCYPEKFGIPRQPGLVPDAPAVVHLHPPYASSEALRGLDAFSHIWLVFWFHASAGEGWRPTVRPPRLGGNRRLGVFATRSGFRPNPIGLSAVGLERIDASGGRVRLHVRGADLLDGTPVLDVKPYVPYADRVPAARGGYAADAPGPRLAVRFEPRAEADLACIETRTGLPLRSLVTATLALDPRPAYQGGGSSGRTHGLRLYDFDIRWTVRGHTARVSAIREIGRSRPEPR